MLSMFLKKRDFKIKFLGRSGILYIEGDKQVAVDSEMLFGSLFDLVIYKDSIDKWLIPEGEFISIGEKKRILKNICNYLSKLKYKVDVV
jgi:hypothetical protein